MLVRAARVPKAARRSGHSLFESGVDVGGHFTLDECERLSLQRLGRCLILLRGRDLRLPDAEVRDRQPRAA